MESCDWACFVRDVLALYAAPIRRPATMRKMRQVLGEFGELCQGPTELTPLAIAQWIASHPARRPETVCTLLRSLRAACAYGESRGLFPANPFRFRSPSAWVDWDVEELPPPVHSAEEIARVLARADEEALAGDWRAARLRAVIYAFAFTGARKKELLGLTVTDVDLVAGTIAIACNGRRSLKTRASAAHIPVPTPLASILREWIPQCGSTWLFPGVRRRGPWLEGPVGEKALDQVKALGLRVGVPGLTFQSFRHTFASLSEGWSIGELVLQRILRHSQIRTQRMYRHEMPEVLQAAAAKVHFP